MLITQWLFSSPTSSYYLFWGGLFHFTSSTRYLVFAVLWRKLVHCSASGHRNFVPVDFIGHNLSEGGRCSEVRSKHILEAVILGRQRSTHTHTEISSDICRLLPCSKLIKLISNNILHLVADISPDHPTTRKSHQDEQCFVLKLLTKFAGMLMILAVFAALLAFSCPFCGNLTWLVVSDTGLLCLIPVALLGIQGEHELFLSMKLQYPLLLLNRGLFRKPGDPKEIVFQ